MVKNPPTNAGDAGLIPDQGTKIPQTMGQLSPCTTTTEPACLNYRAWVPQTIEPMCPGACALQLERENPHATTRKKPARCNKRSRVPQRRSHVLQLRPNAVKNNK